MTSEQSSRDMLELLKLLKNTDPETQEESEDCQQLVPDIRRVMAPPVVRRVCRQCGQVGCPYGHDEQIDVRSGS